ncbi:MAG: response regulator [Anaerolineae bacterium]|nr:response regulator [Anaerolineae bacterium]
MNARVTQYTSDTAKVLVVDDDLGSVDLLQAYLEAEGYQVMVAYQGEEALEKAFARQPDLVLLDVIMPGLNGFEVCRRLKADPRTQFVPVVIITALRERKDKIAGAEAGADDFLTKPFDRVELLARTRNLLQIKHLTDKLEHAEDVIFALAAAVEAQTPYTENHLQQMANLSERLAQAAGLDPDQIVAVRYTSILHDVGKIGVNEAVLRKPGPLTEEEWAEVREHPAIGARIVQSMRLAQQVAPIVRGHHERWDGRGYPDGLKGKEIPIGARIVALVDTYDTMTTDRSYRTALPPEVIRAELEQGAGKQFDPELTALFLRLLEEDGVL